jgi:6-bladed beta-propeller
MNNFGCRATICIPVLVIFIYSCNPRPDNISNYIGKSTKTILVNTAAAKNANFSNLFEITKAVRLATNDSVIIGRIDKISYTENRFYILDGKSNYIDIFDDTGRFLFKISAIGEGYGKYFRIADFDIDTSARLIYLLDDFKRKLILFSDIDGRLVSERQLFNFPVNKFLLFRAKGGQHFMYSRGGMPEGHNLWYNILITDTTNNILEHFLPYTPTRTFVLSPVQPLQRTKKGVSYLPPFSNTIFDLTPDERISAKYILDFSGSNADFEKMQTALRENKLPTIGDFLHYLNENNYIHFLNFLETDSLLYIYFTTQKQGNQFLIYQKKTNSSLLISTIYNNYSGFSGHPVGLFCDQLIGLIEPDRFLDKDNPILVMIKPKPF